MSVWVSHKGNIIGASSRRFMNMTWQRGHSKKAKTKKKRVVSIHLSTHFISYHMLKRITETGESKGTTNSEVGNCVGLDRQRNSPAYLASFMGYRSSSLPATPADSRRTVSPFLGLFFKLPSGLGCVCVCGHTRLAKVDRLRALRANLFPTVLRM